MAIARNSVKPKTKWVPLSGSTRSLPASRQFGSPTRAGSKTGVERYFLASVFEADRGSFCGLKPRNSYLVEGVMSPLNLG